MKEVFREGWHLLLPSLPSWDFSRRLFRGEGGLWSINCLVVASWLGQEKYRMTPRWILDSLINGAINAVEVAAAVRAAGLVIGVIGITGVDWPFPPL